MHRRDAEDAERIVGFFQILKNVILQADRDRLTAGG
jgi:hypothetical protein